MVEEPTIAPVTIPVVASIVALVLLLLHVPPGVASLSVVVKPKHTAGVPRIADNGFTVAVTVAIQVVGSIYVIIGLPAATPVTVPSVPTSARPVLLLLQMPPGVWSLSDVVSVAQTIGVPEIPDGFGLTVTLAVVIHEVGKV